MKKIFSLQSVITLLPLFLLFSFVIFSCESNDPKNFVLGTWNRDSCKTDGSFEELKLVIESDGGELYEITITIQSANSGLIQRQKRGVFRSAMGHTMIDIEDNNSLNIEMYPESKKIKYSGCWYTKQ